MSSFRIVGAIPCTIVYWHFVLHILKFWALLESGNIRANNFPILSHALNEMFCFTMYKHQSVSAVATSSDTKYLLERSVEVGALEADEVEGGGIVADDKLAD